MVRGPDPGLIFTTTFLDRGAAIIPARKKPIVARFITLAPKKLILTRRASEGSASEPSLARRVSMCKDAKLSCRGNTVELQAGRGLLSFSHGERGEPRLRGRAGTAG